MEKDDMMVPKTLMKRPCFVPLVGIPWLVTIGTLFANLWINNTDAGVTWTVVALLFTILTGALPGCLKYTLKRPLSKRVWLHIVVGDVSLVATAVATALASDEGLAIMWFAIVANALSAVGSHLVFVFWDEGREMRRVELESKPYTTVDGIPVFNFVPTDDTPVNNPPASIFLSGILLVALFLFWIVMTFVNGWHAGAYVYIVTTLIYGGIVEGIYFEYFDPTRPLWRALKVTLLGVGVLASSHSVGLGRVNDNETRLALDWTSFVAIQLLAILEHRQ